MFHNKIDRAKTFTLLHISYCVISALALVISYAINGFTVENWKSSDGASLFYIPLMLIVYFCFCFAWCINDRIALLAISKKKHKLLKYHLNFAITIMIFSAPIFVCLNVFWNTNEFIFIVLLVPDQERIFNACYFDAK